MKAVINRLTLCLACLLFSCGETERSKTHSVEVFDQIYPPLKYRITGAIIDGKKSGLWITYDSLGKVETEETYLNGKNFGVVKMYSNEMLVEKSSDKIMSNDTISYYEKYNSYGKIIIKGQYINGQKKGTWLYYFNNSRTLKLKINYLEKRIDTLYKSPQYFEGDY